MIAITVQNNNGLNEVTKWKQWRIIDNHMVLSCTEAPVADLVFELESQLPSFTIHTFVKQSQQEYFEKKRKALEPTDLILEINFEENYRLISQNKI